MRRGQVALEFLTTYGWAILVVLVAIGALAYFGVFNVRDTIPDRCIVSEAVTCKDFQLTAHDPSVGASEVSIIFQNTMGKTIYLNKAVVEHNGVAGGTFCGLWRDVGGESESTTWTLGTGGEVEMVCDSGDGGNIVLTEGVVERVTFTFTYTLSPSGLPHAVDGEVIATVQPQS